MMDVKDIMEFRRKLKIGQIVKIEKEVFVETGKRTHVIRSTVEAEVIKKYPHIVEVMPLGKKGTLPRRTAAYAEILTLN